MGPQDAAFLRQAVATAQYELACAEPAWMLQAIEQQQGGSAKRTIWGRARLDLDILL